MTHLSDRANKILGTDTPLKTVQFFKDIMKQKIFCGNQRSQNLKNTPEYASIYHFIR